MAAGHPRHLAAGIRTTAGVVTSAAIIMVAVFAVFGTLSLQPFKQLSVGLAVAVLLDATVVRGVLLPSAMALLGDRTWYLPRWLSWLPPDTAAGDTGSGRFRYPARRTRACHRRPRLAALSGPSAIPCQALGPVLWRPADLAVLHHAVGIVRIRHRSRAFLRPGRHVRGLSPARPVHEPLTGTHLTR